MPTLSLPDKSPRWTLLCAGLLIMVGGAALIGRFTGRMGLVTLLPGGSPTAFMAAVGVLLGGCGFLAHGTGRAKTGQALGAGLALVGAALLFFYAGRNHLGWFQTAFAWVDAAPFGLRFRSPVSLTTSACFIFWGVALALFGRPQPFVRTFLIGGAVMFSVPLLAVLGYLTKVERYSFWWRDAGMAFPVALGLMAAAGVLIYWGMQNLPRERRSSLRTVPVLIAVTGLIVVTGVTALVSNRERERVAEQMGNSTDLIAALDLLLADCDRLQSERINARFHNGVTEGIDGLENKLKETLARVRQAVDKTPPYQARQMKGNEAPRLIKPVQEKLIGELERLLRQEFEVARAQAKVQEGADMMQLSLMPTIRFRLVEFTAEERRALDERQVMARDAANRTDLVILLGNALAAALGLLALIFIRRADRGRSVAIGALRESEERFRSAFDHAGIGMTIVALDGRLVRVNRALCDILGYDEDTLRKKTFQELTHPEDLELDLALVDEVLGGSRRSYQMEKRYFHRDGHIVWARLTVSLVTDAAGRPANFVSQVEDISELRKLIERLATARDEALSASRHKSEFLANMSHELRTPMNGVMGMATLLLDSALTDDQRDMGLTIQQSAENLLLIINDVLDFSKIEAGKLSIDEMPLELKCVVSNTVSLLLPRAAEKRIGLRWEMDAGLEGSVRGDAGRIRQVLTNLIGNAVKFTDRGEVCLKVSCVRATSTALTVRFEVRDTGIGIAPEGQQRLFQPFTQVDGTTTRRFGGTGLGLAISRQLVELMGGTIGMSSEPGKGSVFWFELPLRRSAVVLSELAPEPVAEGTGNSGVGGLKFLVVEDNKVNQIVARRLLEKSGGVVEVADNGVEALQRLVSARYDVVLMDCQMPEMDGYTATERIRGGKVPGVDPRIPIIALTAYAMQGDREKCLAAGMDEYVTKPLRLDALRAAMKKLNLPGASLS